MLPVMLDLTRLPLLLIGNGAAAARRLQRLDEAGAARLSVHADVPTAALAAAAGRRLVPRLPSPAELAAARVVFIADPAPNDCDALAAAARAAGALVHVEDAPALSDLHAPAVLRRGALTIAIATSGLSPALATRLKAFLGGVFGPEWAGRLERLAAERRRWRASGAEPAVIAQRTDEFLATQDWPGPTQR
jgi:precorrin-2 dehydrogenase / sirohydrochlorin ferrochelatase